MNISVIVPCFNEEKAIEQTIQELQQATSEFEQCEIIVINDGSHDGTPAVLQRLSEMTPNLMVMHHATNRGYGASLKTGIRRAKGDWVVITDADGTYPNHKIPDLIRLTEHNDMVVGARTGTDVKYPFIRKIPKWFLSRFVAWIAAQPVPDINSGLRVFRKDLAKQFMHMLPDGFSFTTTITLALLTNNYLVHYEPINYEMRIGTSKIQPIRDTLRFIQLIFRMGMYFAPLKVFSPLIAIWCVAFMLSAFHDIYNLENLTDKTLIFLMLFLNTGLFALLADMIDKRSPREHK